MSTTKSADQWFAEYGESHQNTVNKTIHWICVPTIYHCVLGLISSIPVPDALATAAPWFDWALPVAMGVMLFYLRLSLNLAIGMFAFTCMCYLFIQLQMTGRCPVPVWKSSLGIFVVAWIFQFIGHKIEGKKPSFFHDVIFLLIGPAWLLHFIYRKAGVKY